MPAANAYPDADCYPNAHPYSDPNADTNTYADADTYSDPTPTPTPTPTPPYADTTLVYWSWDQPGRMAAIPTVKDAFDALNANGTQGGNAITLSIICDTIETAPAVLNQPSVSSWTSLTIIPSGVGDRTVSGAMLDGSPLIDLNGADSVTINGDPASTDLPHLTISNTTVGTLAGSSTVRFINDASNNTVRRCNIQGSAVTSLTTSSGTILFDTGTTTGNDNNVVLLCNIGPAGTNLPTKAVHGAGSTSSAAIRNSGVSINGNEIFDFFGTGAISVAGINVNSGNDSWNITSNRIYQTAPRTFTGGSGIRYSGIVLNTVTLPGSFNVLSNIIGFGLGNLTGTTTITGTGTGLGNEIRGIEAPSVDTVVATSIQDNLIANFNQTTNRNSTSTTLSAFIGIALGTVVDGRFNVGGSLANQIGSLNGSFTIVVNQASITANTAPIKGILDFSFQSNVISNNNIGAFTIQGTGTRTGFRGIFAFTNTGLTETVANNTIGGAGAGAITNTQVGSYRYVRNPILFG